MSDNSKQPDFFQELADELRAIPRGLRDGWAQAGVNVQNMLVRARRKRVDYIVLPLGGPLPERSAPPRSFIQRQLPLPPDPLSLETVNRRLQVIADADNVRGVLFVLGGLGGGLAKLQSLRRSIERLREAGKTVVVFTPYLDLPHYFVAAAADRVIAPPGAEFELLGLSSEITFLKDSLGKVGVQMDVVQISPYKAALDNLGRADMSAELREQIGWLLDDDFDLIVTAVAADRGFAPDELRALIDQAPFTTEQALAHGFLDAVAYEDELPYLLAAWDTPAPEAEAAAEDDVAAEGAAAAPQPPVEEAETAPESEAAPAEETEE